MFNELKQIPVAWSRVWASRSFRNQFIISVLIFVAVALHNFHFLRLWQDRPGILVNDLVLNHLPPIDFSWIIFALEYSTLLLVFVFILPYPERLVKGIQIFALVFIARTMCIYLFPLEPPKDMVFLYDPVAELLLHTRDSVVTKDLFFSGHVSALSALMLISAKVWVRRWAGMATVVVGCLIMWQHVHYSMDVAFAPIVSYVSYKFIHYIHRQTKYGLELQDV